MFLPDSFLTRFASKLSRRRRSSTIESLTFPRVLPPVQISITIHTRCLPEFPAEVWLLIFRFATDYITAFNPFDFPANPQTSSDISFLTFPHSHSCLDIRLASYFSVMAYKMRLSLVCKRWYKIAQELVYETIWINKPVQAALLARVLAQPERSPLPIELREETKGRYIKRLHIETPTMERCSPEDLRTIVDHAPRLVAYTDYRSIRRNVYAENTTTNWASPTELFNAIAHRDSPLRHLSWTNYDDLSFHLQLPTMLSTIASNLEFLELTFCSSDIRNFKSSPLQDPAMTLTLPKLRSLKLTLDNATFTVLTSWTMPSLENLSVVSADFSYAGDGFCQFFRRHGDKLLQLELGHSSSVIEEHYLTIPVDPPLNNGPRSIRLAEWCPNLVQFVCSADAEWNWQNPDWIAPHVLLPAHPKLQIIGIRDIDKRLRDDMSLTAPHTHEHPFFMLLSQMETLLQGSSFPNLGFIRDLSFESDVMRRKACSQDVLDFWTRVIDLCRASNVYLEDYRGKNLTRRDIVRAEVEAIMRDQEMERMEQLRRGKSRWRQFIASTSGN